MAPTTLSALQRALGEDWAEPQKLHHQSAQLRIKLDQARARIAANLGVSPTELEFVGEVGFGFWSAIAGLLAGGAETMIFSSIDRQIVHAFGRENLARGGQTLIAPISQEGRFNLVAEINSAKSVTLIWQGTNRELSLIHI